jgi:broad specificity phosphatase PhoE
MKQLALIRHAATDLSGTFCGHIDPSLNSLGEAQARELVNCLRGRSFTSIYSSDLLRARQTAELVSDSLHTPLRLFPDLREIAFGKWEGLRWNEIEARFPHEAQTWMAGYPHCATLGGENFDAFQLRVMCCIRKILGESNGPVCIVSHGGVIRLLLTQIFDVDEAEAWSLTREHAKVIDLPLTESHREKFSEIPAILQRVQNSSGENNEYRNQAW